MQLEALPDGTLCMLNGDLLHAGSSFTLHHGDRLVIGSERLFLVCLWKPAHDSSQQQQQHPQQQQQQQRGKDTSTDPLPMYRGHRYSHSLIATDWL